MSTATRTRTHAKSILEPGDFLPLFHLQDGNDRPFAIENFGGRPGVIFFLPIIDKDVFDEFLGYLRENNCPEIQEAWKVVVTCNAAETIDLPPGGMPHIICGDAARQLIHDMGLWDTINQEKLGACYIVDRNLRASEHINGLGLDALAAVAASKLREKMEDRQRARQDARVISSLPPVLIIPNAISPELREKCLAAYRNGNRFQGTVGEKGMLRPDVKIRTDHIVSRELAFEIDDKLSRSVMPEIQKVFGITIPYRENYKIGEYKGEDGGHFRAHRDNFDPPLGYRRFAVSIQLSEGFEGGGVRFNEYGDDIVAPPKDSAVIFNCAVLHEAVKVTAGSRFILLTFVHGDEDEAYRRYYHGTRNQPLKPYDFTLAARQPASVPQSRDFFWKWREDAIVSTMIPEKSSRNKISPAEAELTPAAHLHKEKHTMISHSHNHQPRKVFESKEAIVFDDFLPEDVYQRMYDFAIKSDYQRINTHGTVARAWCVEDGFPFRSSYNYFYYAQGSEKPKGDHLYPTKTDADIFMDHLLAIQPQVEHIVGKQGTGWEHFSFTAWMYPAGTALSMHDDGAGVYHGAYAYYLNPVWRPHWGGLNILIDEKGNKPVYDHAKKIGGMEFYRRKWLHANQLDEILMDHGLAYCVFPKRNRIAFIAEDAWHMVTRVNEAAGDNHRMTLTGFFNRPKTKPEAKAQLGGYT